MVKVVIVVISVLDVWFKKINFVYELKVEMNKIVVYSKKIFFLENLFFIRLVVLDSFLGILFIKIVIIRS